MQPDFYVMCVTVDVIPITIEKEDDADVVSLTTQRRLRSRTKNAAKSTVASTCR